LGSYLTAHPPKGIGVHLDVVHKLIKDDKEAEPMFREATTREKGTNQHTLKEDNDNIMIHSKPEQGTSRAYTLSRLKSERRDLFERVIVTFGDNWRNPSGQWLPLGQRI
jgi:hypothetical protein